MFPSGEPPHTTDGSHGHWGDAAGWAGWVLTRLRTVCEGHLTCPAGLTPSTLVLPVPGAPSAIPAPAPAAVAFCVPSRGRWHKPSYFYF